MAKHLVLSATGANWRLAHDVNVDDLHSRLMTAMMHGQVVEVEVEANDNPLGKATLLLNGKVLEMAAIMDIPPGL